MSASPHSFPGVPRSPDVLSELLHSLSQPLTSLRCSLELSLEPPPRLSRELSCELSLDELAEQQQESVSAALEQTEKVIAMIQLMREYLDAEQPGSQACAVALAPAMRSVVEELATIAEVRGIQLRLVGTCTATLPIPELRLRLALQYLIATMIEAQPMGGKVTLRLEEGPAGAVLRAEGDSASATPASASTLRRVRLAIASRVLDAAGASLVFGGGDSSGFVLRISR